jgi:hypothetical protein
MEMSPPCATSFDASTHPAPRCCLGLKTWRCCQTSWLVLNLGFGNISHPTKITKVPMSLYISVCISFKVPKISLKVQQNFKIKNEF